MDSFTVLFEEICSVFKNFTQFSEFGEAILKMNIFFIFKCDKLKFLYLHTGIVR